MALVAALSLTIQVVEVELMAKIEWAIHECQKADWELSGSIHHYYGTQVALIHEESEVHLECWAANGLVV